jgi:DNA-binding protein WhiA
MSYTSKVKKEILNNLNLSDSEKTIELASILSIKNALSKEKIVLNLENLEIAKRVYTFFKELTPMKIGIKYSTSKKLGPHKVFTILVEKQKYFNEFYKKLIIDTDVTLKNKKYLNSYIRGIFLACGYLKDPNNEYSLDFFIDNEVEANHLFTVLNKINKKSFITKKRSKHLVYLRNSEDIMDILVIVGAIEEFFAYENITIMKELKNKTVREMNWEVANETKTLNTGKNQIKMINYIIENLGLNNLSEILGEAALVRLNNPEGSLQEIADIVGISKSGIRNRFKRIEEIFKNLLIENSESGE